MKIFSSIQEFCLESPVVLTIGSFDGVHIGHQKIIAQLNEIAEKINGESVLLTFSPHPRLVLQKDSDLQLLNDFDEKIEYLEKAGLKNLVIHNFTKEFSRLNSIEFVRDYLVNLLNVKVLIIGYDHQFGRNREGSFSQLEELADLYDFELQRIKEVKNSDKKVSSTKIRDALQNGDLTFAEEAMGRAYRLSGKVIHGEKIGRTIGFPTANILVKETKLIPKNGVYAVRVKLESGKEKFGMLNIGIRPTVSTKQKKQVEVYLFDFDSDLYGTNIKIELIEFIRDEQKFASLTELESQLSKDKKIIRNLVKNLG